MKKPEWLPNWRNVSEYPSPATTTNQQWAWEFLRRNAEYQADYKEIILFQETDDPDLNERAQEVINSFFEPIDFSKSGQSTIAFLIGHLLPAMHEKKENYPWIPEVCWHLVSKYNLNFPVNPSQPFANGIFIESDNLPVIETTDLIIHPRSIPNEQKVTLTIDLSGNLSDQLKYIQGFIEAYPKNTEKQRKIGYLDCLRVLDGKASRAPWKTIADVLKKEEDAYYKIAAKAEKLRSKDFFDLSKSNLIPGEGNRLKQGQTAGKEFFELNASARSLRKSLGGNNSISTNGITIWLKPNPPTP